jgi:antitoxin PrlF
VSRTGIAIVWKFIDAAGPQYYFYGKCNTGAAMTTTVTSKGQVTLPKQVREAAGIKPGDRVDVEATASGAISIKKPGTSSEYRKRLLAIAKRRPIRDGMTTDEFMELMRGEVPSHPRRKNDARR